MNETDIPADFDTLPDLAGRPLGGSVVAASDEFFAEKENLVKPEEPTFQPYTFSHKGQVYDGWETRRLRDPGNDWAIVRLGAPGTVRGVVVDTRHFTGNHPEYCSVEACAADGYPSPGELARDDLEWVELVPKRKLEGDTANRFPVDVEGRFTHVRLSIYPDGGVARLRVHGEAVPDPRDLAGMPLDLAATENGGTVAGCSDMFFSSPGNLLLPGLARVMGEGWETARRRGSGNDWVTVRLGASGHVRQAELDTSHFKGNAPGWAALYGCDGRTSSPEAPSAWSELLPRTRLQPDTRHRFRVHDAPATTHVRLDVYPDGGMARLRLYGDLSSEGAADVALRWFNSLPRGRARRFLEADAGLPADAARELLDVRPVRERAALPDLVRTALAGR